MGGHKSQTETASISPAVGSWRRGFRGALSSTRDYAWCLLRGKSRSKAEASSAPRTGEEALRSMRVLHERIMVSQKLLFLKCDGLTFCFNPNLQVWGAVIKIKASAVQANAVFWVGLHGLCAAISATGRVSREEGGGEEQGIIHILTMSSFPSSSTTKSSPVLNLTSLQTGAENKPHCKNLHGSPLQTCFPLFIVFSVHEHADHPWYQVA